MRLLIVSNRLPFTVVEKGRKLEFRETTGGLVSGLSAYLDSLRGLPLARTEHLWIGWPGVSIRKSMVDQLKHQALDSFRAFPVCLAEETMEKFYHGFCNKTIWPLFHYFPSYAAYDESHWAQYKIVNQMFCDAVIEIMQPDDLVWIHDYHLMLLPKMLKDRVSHASVGFFLHIPFPSYEICRLIPTEWRTEILKGLLGADLLGFHLPDYVQHFFRTASRFLELKRTRNSITIAGHKTTVKAFPMGIDFEKYHRAGMSPEMQQDRDALKKGLENSKTILSVDRLDYSKGVINRLEGYELFLEQNPVWHRKVVFTLIVVPSRIGVDHYQQTKIRIDELVGRINGQFGGTGWVPILYQYRFLPFHPLVALYTASDVALVTPLRDGMNLVAKEYVASRTDHTGVLILSEMAGAVRELKEAIIINPNNNQNIADALKQALEMPLHEQRRRNRVMQARLKRNTVVRWAENFLETLQDTKSMQ